MRGLFWTVIIGSSPTKIVPKLNFTAKNLNEASWSYVKKLYCFYPVDKIVNPEPILRGSALKFLQGQALFSEGRNGNVEKV